MAEEKPIIVIKKKGNHGGHHGGAWKVAYADFVTAMMCFFMVMWLINSAENPTKKSIASYFRRPGLFAHGSGTPLLIGQSGILEDGVPPAKIKHSKNVSTDMQRIPRRENPDDTQERKLPIADSESKGLLKEKGETSGFSEKENSEKELHINKERRSSDENESEGDKQQRKLKEIADKLNKEIAENPGLKQMLGIVDVKVDADGLNIEIIDTEKTSMFASGSARVMDEAQAAFSKIGEFIAKLPYSIEILGHTDAKPFSSRSSGYTNWELSADRANSARKILERVGIPAERFTSVVGRADRDLRKKDDPFAPSNRRITLKLKVPMTKSIQVEDLPQALEELEKAPPESTTKSPAQSGVQLPPATTLPGSEEKVHTLTPKEIIEGQSNQDKETLVLPEEEPTKENPVYIEKDRIFGDNPVLGPPLPFSNL